MNLTITKEENQVIEMYLNVILHDSQNLTSGNIAHRAASIKGHAEAIKKIIGRPKYKCAICKDTGIVEDENYMGHTRGVELTSIPCPSCSKKKN